MDILFEDDNLEKLCTDEKLMNRQLGKNGAKKLRTRLADLRAAETMSDVHQGRPHPLKGDRAGCLALDLDGGRRLVLEAADEPPPVKDDGSLDWSKVSAVRIVFIGDYHD